MRRTAEPEADVRVHDANILDGPVIGSPRVKGLAAGIIASLMGRAFDEQVRNTRVTTRKDKAKVGRGADKRCVPHASALDGQAINTERSTVVVDTRRKPNDGRLLLGGGEALFDRG